jgi:hypothetical protein
VSPPPNRLLNHAGKQNSLRCTRIAGAEIAPAFFCARLLSGFFLKKKPPPNTLEKSICIPEML